MQSLYLKINKKGENLWVKEIRKSRNSFKGVIDNEPINKMYKEGQNIQFKKSDVIDFDLM